MSPILTANRPKAAMMMDEDLPSRLFPPGVFRELGVLLELRQSPITSKSLVSTELQDLELVIGGWGCPLLDAELLDRMPALKAVIYTAGSVRSFATDELFQRGIAVSSGADINAAPVAEYTLASILMAGKRIPEIAGAYRATRMYRPFVEEPSQWGNFGLNVGIVGASRIGRRVIQLLSPFDVDVVFYDPFAAHDVLGQAGRSRGTFEYK